MSVMVRHATGADVPLLASMNRRLIEDEGSRNPMSLPELERRMAHWLHTEWTADLFVLEGTTIGYAVHQRQQDDHDPHKFGYYVRHFYIERAFRRRGLGRASFEALARTRFSAGCTVTLDVLAVNTAGQAFWDCLGFCPYATTLKRTL
jgi:GNAT superfamily N-acetyltransferase